MTRAKKAKAPDYDRNEWEYVTYAPGYECSACHRPIKALEPARRGTVERTAGVPVPSYRHAESCPGQAAA
ncbi:hypothetical protein ACWCQL_20250 [Streptomyces sp. NPDC002073]|uniref:hypothetical protein n=1 Tax=Streptomyces sp. NBC_00239 TaxID=2903640 RepID=UPI002E28C55A|nr:hypothetical protein [Streptomyces sp. NBC_00239]